MASNPSPAPADTARARTTVLPAKTGGSLSLQTHPLARRHYRVATAAIESFVDLVEHCVRVLIPGALVYARPRIGKTQAIDYLTLHLAKHRPDIVVLRLSCEHHRSDFEGPFFQQFAVSSGSPPATTEVDFRQTICAAVPNHRAGSGARGSHCCVDVR